MKIITPPARSTRGKKNSNMFFYCTYDFKSSKLPLMNHFLVYMKALQAVVLERVDMVRELLYFKGRVFSRIQ